MYHTNSFIHSFTHVSLPSPTPQTTRICLDCGGDRFCETCYDKVWNIRASPPCVFCYSSYSRASSPPLPPQDILTRGLLAPADPQKKTTCSATRRRRWCQCVTRAATEWRACRHVRVHDFCCILLSSFTVFQGRFWDIYTVLEF